VAKRSSLFLSPTASSYPPGLICQDDMIDIEKQIDFWYDGAIEDWAVANDLVLREEHKARIVFCAPGFGKDTEGTGLQGYSGHCTASP
jgi:hypothetical protein